jgi:hypothetical protein
MNEQRKLRLHRETLRELTADERGVVIGGDGSTVSPCDTVADDNSDHTCTQHPTIPCNTNTESVIDC